MQLHKKINLFLLGLAFTFAGCYPDFEDVPTPSSGELDFSNYVAIGDSYSAGYLDGGVYAEGQAQSLPAIIGKQLEAAGGGAVVQPDVQGNGSGYTFIESFDATGNPIFGSREADANFGAKVAGPFNNIAVPGIKVAHTQIPGYATLNPFYNRMLPAGDEAKTYFAYATEANASFFTCWLGGNDVLTYAAAGGDETLPDATITEVAVFQASYDAMINGLTANGAKGAIATLASVAKLPYFNVVKWNDAVLTAEQAALANATYEGMIDPSLTATIVTGVATQFVAQGAVEEGITAQVVTGAVKQQVFDQAIANGASEAQAEQTANDFIASPDGQQQIADLIASLGATGEPAQLAAIIAENLASPAAQAQITALVDAYNAGQLPPDQQAQFEVTITGVIAAYNAGLLPPEDQALAEATVTAVFNQTKAALQQAGIYPTFQEGANGLVMAQPMTATNPLGIRQMQEGEYVLLTAVIAGKFDSPESSLLPLEDQFTLDLAEVAAIDAATTAFNNVIKGYESNPNIAVVDTEAFLAEIENGFVKDGFTGNSDFVSGGLFSLDGIHPTPRGYTFAANAFIKAINAKFGAVITPANIGDYRANIFP